MCASCTAFRSTFAHIHTAFGHRIQTEPRPRLTFLRWFSLSTLRADGTTKRFFWSYGGGMPSNTRSLPRHSSPLGVLCGSMPRTVRQKILLGALKWCGPWFGFTLHLLRKKSRYFTVDEKNFWISASASAAVERNRVRADQSNRIEVRDNHWRSSNVGKVEFGLIICTALASGDRRRNSHLFL